MTAHLHMKEVRRRPGSEWLKDHPRVLAIAYDLTKRAFIAMYPRVKRLAPAASERIITWSEARLKGWLFNCQMCGQCILHSTGMTCPMNCPKNLRNGPCGGVRQNGHCEVIPEMPCVWVQAWERSQRMNRFASDLQIIQAPVNRALQNTSAWINMFEGIDTQTPPGWASGEQDIQQK